MEGDEIDLRGIFAVLGRRIRWILATIAGACMATAVALLVITPVYSANTLVLFDARSVNLLGPEITGSSSASESARIESEVELIRSDIVLLKVLRRLSTAGIPEIGPIPEDSAPPAAFFAFLTPPALNQEQVLERHLAKLRNAIHVERRGSTYLIAIEARSASAEGAAQIANAIASAYIEAQVDRKAAAIAAAQQAIDRRLETLGTRDQAARSMLLSRAEDLDLRSGLQLADSDIVSPALTPAAPSQPNPAALILLALFAGGFCGIALAFTVEHLVGGFTSQDQLETVLRQHSAASIPHTRTAPGEVLIQQPLSSFSEGVRRLQATVDLVLHRTTANADGTMVMVTSAGTREGKTTIALALARTYALSGRSTLLIDGDLRAPDIHRQLAVSPALGLSDLLDHPDGALDVASAIIRDTETDLTVLVGARGREKPTDQLVAGHNFVRLLQAARRSYDVIILDTPSVAAMVDTLYLAQYADLMLFVTRWGSTSQRQAKRALDNLMDATGRKVPLLALLNQQEHHLALSGFPRPRFVAAMG